jgi:hypothetical protein
MPPQPFPEPRIDTLVIDAVSGEQRRRTDYRGSVWFGQRPEIGALRIVAPGSRYMAWESSAFFLPDSLPYRRAELADAQVSCSAAIHAAHLDYHFVLGASASWADDPRGGDLCWLQLGLTVHGSEPMGVSYGVVVLCAPGAVAG